MLFYYNKKAKMSLNKSIDYKTLVMTEMTRVTDLYLKLKEYGSTLTPGYEEVFYNANRDLNYQTMLIISAVCNDDSDEDIRRKIQMVSKFVDDFASIRIFNFKKVNWNTNKYLLFRVMREIRNKDCRTVGMVLVRALRRMDVSIDAITKFSLNQFSGRYMLHLLARFTSYVNTKMGNPSLFDVYVDRKRKGNTYDIEHILPDDYDSYQDDFATADEFQTSRQMIGNLIILTRDKNRSYQAMKYQEKVGKYIGDNVLAQALNDTAYHNNPKFLAVPRPIEECGFWPFEKEKEYEEYILGTDTDGQPISYTCNPDLLGNYFGANPAAPMYLTPVFFSRDVLRKYYDQPELYTISDGYLSCQSLWGIELDNHYIDRISVYLGDLGRDLPASEQKHWKAYNILSDEPQSSVSITRDMLCYPAESNTIEHQFKRNYEQLNKLWEVAHGWPLYIQLQDEDSYVFDQIRRPISDGQAEFDQLVLLLCKVIIDALNEKKLIEGLDSVEDGLKGISKLERWIKAHEGYEYEKHIAFLRSLWDLRSSGVGHAKGKKYQKAVKAFAIDDIPLPDVYDNILRDADSYLRYMISSFT